MNEAFEKNGFVIVKDAFKKTELTELYDVISKFHHAWVSDNADFYYKRAINSAYLTGSKYLNDQDRLLLFNYISSQPILDVLQTIIPDSPAFMNSQLFFNPVNPDQKNYWHRDIQYNEYSIEYQKAAIASDIVVHFRIPLKPEPGLEVVPGSHKRWDTYEEFDIRLEQNGRRSFDAIQTGKILTVDPGDMLMFSANIIHRGIYGMDRFIFDVLFCESKPELLKFCDSDCYPGSSILPELINPEVFTNLDY